MKQKSKYFFIGVGGIGMSALARYVNAQGHQVAGYDRTSTELTKELEGEGIDIIYSDDPGSIPKEFLTITDDLLVVRTPAVPRENALLKFFLDQGAHMLKRSEFLAHLSSEKRCIAVAGTHGKTTTTSILAHILHNSPLGCTAFVGGIMTGYGTNVIINPASPFIVLEADEFDRSFHYLRPEVAIVTSTDADHLDIYGDSDSVKAAFTQFVGQVEAQGRVFAHVEAELDTNQEPRFSYGIEEGDIQARNIRVKDGSFVFDADFGSENATGLSLSLPGRHNILNALAASAAALKVGVPLSDVVSALRSYKGVRRRFEFIDVSRELIFIDDYAHHPSEITACISSVKELFPEKKITAVFQPHLFSRTQDFMDGFAEALSLADELILVEIYPARERPIFGVSSSVLLDKVMLTNKVLCEKEELPSHIAARELEVLLTMGAGDIDREIPRIQKRLKVKQREA